MTITGREQAEVAHFDKAWWEDVLEEATDERFGRHLTGLELVSGRLFIYESDVPIFQLAQTVVANGHAKDVRGEILEGLLARADGFGVDYPIFAPDPGRYLSKQFSLLEGIAELGAEDARKRFDVDQEVFA